MFVPNLYITVSLPTRTQSPPAFGSRQPIAGSPPSTLRTAPRGGHNRGVSSGSINGISPSATASDTMRRPNGFPILNPPSSPTQSNYSLQSPPSTGRQTPRSIRQRPSGLQVDNSSSRPSLSPTRSSSGRQSPNGRPRDQGQSASSPPTNFVYSPPATAQRGIASYSTTTLNSSPSLLSYTRESNVPPSRSRPNGLVGESMDRPSDEIQRDSQQGYLSSSRPSLETTRAASPALSNSSTSRRRAPAPPSFNNRNSDRAASPIPSTSCSRGIPRSRSPATLGSEPVNQRTEPAARPEGADSKNQPSTERLFSHESAAATDSMDEGDLEATLANVEDILEGYEWTSGDTNARKSQKGAADQIEARLITELTALEKVRACLLER